MQIPGPKSVFWACSFLGCFPIISKFVNLWSSCRERVAKVYRLRLSHFVSKGYVAQRFWKIRQWLLKTEFTLVSEYHLYSSQSWPPVPVTCPYAHHIHYHPFAYSRVTFASHNHPSISVGCVLITYSPFLKLSPDCLICKCNSRLTLYVKLPVTTSAVIISNKHL